MAFAEDKKSNWFSSSINHSSQAVQEIGGVFKHAPHTPKHLI